RPRDREIVIVDVNTDVFGAGKTTGVSTGAAANVEHSAGVRAQETAFNRRELPGGERGLPRRVDGGTFQHTVDQASYRHLISKLPCCSPLENSLRSTVRTLCDSAWENGGAWLTTT